MRKRINRACVASSSNYTQSKKAHIAHLEENHTNNSVFFMAISTLPSKPKSDLELFEEGLKEKIDSYKQKKTI